MAKQTAEKMEEGSEPKKSMKVGKLPKKDKKRLPRKEKKANKKASAALKA